MKTTVRRMKLSTWQLTHLLEFCDFAYANVNPANSSFCNLTVRLNITDLEKSLRREQESMQGIVSRQPMFLVDVYTDEDGEKFIVLKGGRS